MSAAQCPDEPITAAVPATGRDGLEHWLHDLRTELSNDPPGWLDADSTRDGSTTGPLSELTGQPTVDDDVEHQSPAAAPATLETGGRHRAKH